MPDSIEQYLCNHHLLRFYFCYYVVKGKKKKQKEWIIWWSEHENWLPICVLIQCALSAEMKFTEVIMGKKIKMLLFLSTSTLLFWQIQKCQWFLILGSEKVLISRLFVTFPVLVQLKKYFSNEMVDSKIMQKEAEFSDHVNKITTPNLWTQWTYKSKGLSLKIPDI